MRPKFVPTSIKTGSLIGSLAISLFFLAGQASALTVNITKDIAEITVKHGTKSVSIQRDQNTNAIIDPAFAKTSRKCPPFCAQTMNAGPGVTTVGEAELIHFLATKVKDGSGLLMDARTPDWHARGTIPSAVNVPYTDVNPSLGADKVAIADAMELFSVAKAGSGWDFSNAKTLAVFCNGPWCGQSHTAIKGLIELGYPGNKILYYRGGMQLWKTFGLTVVAPAEED